MRSRSLFVSFLTVSLLQVLGDFAGAAGAGTTAPSFLKLGESAKKNVIEVEYRPRGARLYLPIAPAYLAYDYPYYYGRGYYPTSISPGYIHYGYPYFHRRSKYLRYGGR